jgi:hypothetical protein
MRWQEVEESPALYPAARLVRFDKLSRLPENLTDAACGLAIGGGFGGRQLYKDHDEAIFYATARWSSTPSPSLVPEGRTSSTGRSSSSSWPAARA